MENREEKPSLLFLVLAILAAVWPPIAMVAMVWLAKIGLSRLLPAGGGNLEPDPMTGCRVPALYRTGAGAEKNPSSTGQCRARGKVFVITLQQSMGYQCSTD
jgi:hypothetical protein